MPTTLSPSQAAAMADGVYLLRTQTIAGLRRTGERIGCEPIFSVMDDDRFTGISGAVFRMATGFGYLAQGNDAFAGHIAVVTRGTFMPSLFDWASNANIGLQRGPGGQLVHAGFNEVWTSFRPMLDAYLRGRNPTHIHCVGHSLGGALAMLNADYFTTNKVAPVSTYTFGTPRTGTAWFARELTERVGVDRIFRLSHEADPVPMIPLFPFRHAPIGQTEYILGRAGGQSFISPSAHGMVSSYSPGVAGKDWGSFARHESEVTDAEIHAWLSFSRNGDGVLTGSAEALRMIGRLLRWMLRKSALLLANTFMFSATAGITLLDQIAALVDSGMRLSRELSEAGMAMARAVFRFLGRTTAAAYDLTVQFLRWMLGLLYASVGAMARHALASMGS